MHHACLVIGTVFMGTYRLLLTSSQIHLSVTFLHPIRIEFVDDIST